MSRFGNAILCDAVYIDRATNKAVLAGVYGGSVSLTEIPAGFNAAIYVEFIPDKDGNFDVEMIFYLSGARLGGAKMRLEGGVADTVSMLVVPSYPFAFATSGELEVRIAINGGNAATVLKKKVEKV